MIPTAWVSPVGSLSTERFCGPITYPVAVVKDLSAPPSGVAMIGAPSTITATQDPVGAIRSRRYPIPPRANHPAAREPHRLDESSQVTVRLPGHEGQSHAARWMPGAGSLRDRGASAPGTALVFTARGKERTGQIAAPEVGRSITLRSVQGGVTGDYVCACSQQDAWTGVSLTVDCRTSGAFRLPSPVI